MPRAPKHCGINGCQVLVPNGKRCPDHAHGWKNSPRTASSAVTSTWQWKAFRRTILIRDLHTCQIRTPGICTGIANTVDKIIPAAQRPDLAMDPGNCRASCDPCNDHKARTSDKGIGATHGGYR